MGYLGYGRWTVDALLQAGQAELGLGSGEQVRDQSRKERSSAVVIIASELSLREKLG